MIKTELNSVSAVRKTLRVEVPPDIAQQARTAAIQALQQKAKLPGFRDGKVPLNIIEQKFAHEIDHETIDQIVDLTLAKAFETAKVHPISRPELTPGMWSPAGDYNYTVTFDVLPEIKLKDYKGLKLTKEEVEVLGEEVAGELERLKNAMTQLEPTTPETGLGEGHIAKIDFHGTVGGKPFEGGQIKDYIVETGVGAILPGFEAGLKGMTVGTTKEIGFDYPADYFNKELSGKKAAFTVTMKEIRKKIVPELNDDFAKDLGNFENLEAVKKDIEGKITQFKESHQKGVLFDQIIAQLVEKHDFEVPGTLVDSELRHMIERFAKELENRGQKMEDLKPEEVVKEFQPEAVKRVKGYLILNILASDLKLDVTEKELDQRLEGIAKGYGKPLNEIREYYEKKNLLDSLKIQILHEKALEFVLNQAKIKTEKPKKEKKSKK